MSLRSFTFSLDGHIDPGSVSGRVKVSRRHYSGECGFWFLQRTKEDVSPHEVLLTEVRRPPKDKNI